MQQFVVCDATVAMRCRGLCACGRAAVCWSRHDYCNGQDSEGFDFPTLPHGSSHCVLVNGERLDLASFRRVSRLSSFHVSQRSLHDSGHSSHDQVRVELHGDDDGLGLWLSPVVCLYTGVGTCLLASACAQRTMSTRKVHAATLLETRVRLNSRPKHHHAPLPPSHFVAHPLSPPEHNPTFLVL